MNLAGLTAIKMHLQKQLSELEYIKINCLTCENLQRRSFCKKFEATPPDDWLYKKVDCEHWTWDTIPF